jgi:hypothetical protein
MSWALAVVEKRRKSVGITNVKLLIRELRLESVHILFVLFSVPLGGGLGRMLVAGVASCDAFGGRVNIGRLKRC